MKILIITHGFFPGEKYGGPPVSIDNFCSLMKNDECYIVTLNHDYKSTQPYPNITEGIWVRRSNCHVMYLDDIHYNKKYFEIAIDQINPDVIYLQSLFQACIIPCLRLAKKKNIKTILAPRGELCAGAFKKKYKKIPYLIYLRMNGLTRNLSYQSTSEEETATIIRYLKADKNCIYQMSNIPSIPKEEYVRIVSPKGKGRFVFISRIHSKKNLISAIKYFNDVSGDVRFDIYGPIEDEKYWDECKKEINELPKNIHVNYCGIVSHDKVHEVFCAYDALLFPTFSENYGHVIIEAMIVGTPVIISDQTPWNDINDYEAGWAVPLSEQQNFVEAIQTIVDCDDDYYSKQTKLYVNKKLKLDELYDSYVGMLHHRKESD